ncbi:MAG TPA: gliding motility protein, partial [Polyangiaceae bacterium]
LLHLTWTRLDAEHHLGQMLGVDPGQLLPMAARQLGLSGDVKTLLASCVGGNLDRNTQVPT